MKIIPLYVVIFALLLPTKAQAEPAVIANCQVQLEAALSSIPLYEFEIIPGPEPIETTKWGKHKWRRIFLKNINPKDPDLKFNRTFHYVGKYNYLPMDEMLEVYDVSGKSLGFVLDEDIKVKCISNLID